MSRIVEMAHTAGEFVTGDDGFVVYWPKNQRGGCYSAHDLRALADEIDKRNAAWQAELNAYFEKEPRND
jgi:hypothetical protein